jgi:hypothetical protein
MAKPKEFYTRVRSGAHGAKAAVRQKSLAGMKRALLVGRLISVHAGPVSMVSPGRKNGPERPAR